MRLLLLTFVAVATTAARLGAQTPAPVKTATPPATAAPAKPGQPPAAPQSAPAPQPPTPAPAAPATQGAAPAAQGAAQPAQGSAPAPNGAPAAATPQTPQPEPYTYNPDGRRDPFTSLIGTGGSETRSTTGRRDDGPAGMAVADVSVRGVLQSRGALVAMIQGPDNKTYIVHQGDKLLDGVIKTITPQGLIIIQEVNDPLSLVKQREVSKLLRSLEVVKP
jgi:Tfp pilus assembly protein PilP